MHSHPTPTRSLADDAAARPTDADSLERQLADRDLLIDELKGQVEQLHGKWRRAENAHWADKQSRAWKLAVLLRRARHRIAPNGGLLFRTARLAVHSLRR